MIIKKCNCCLHKHKAIPLGGRLDARGNYYFQCAGGCNSTLMQRPATIWVGRTYREDGLEPKIYKRSPRELVVIWDYGERCQVRNVITGKHRFVDKQELNRKWIVTGRV